MAETGAFGTPDEIAIGQRLEIVVHAHPGRLVFAQQHVRGAGGRIDRQQVERGLVARLTLDIQRFGIARPIDPRDVDIGIGAQVDFHRLAAITGLHIEIDHRIGPARAWVTLFDGGDFQRSYRIGPDHRIHPAFVHPRIGDVAIVGRDPGADRAVQVIRCNEFRDAV